MLESDIVIFFPTTLECKKVLNISSFSQYEYFNISTYKSHPIIVTGIGKTNASMVASLFFSKYKPKYPLLTGICGAYRDTYIKVSDVVSIKYDYFVDEASYNGSNITTLHEKGFQVARDNRAEFMTFNDFKVVQSNTISLIPNIDSLSRLYQEKTKAEVENMEGAAFGTVANIFNIKPYQIRAVSNYCGSLENQQWDIDKACKSLKSAINLFIEKYQ